MSIDNCHLKQCSLSELYKATLVPLMRVMNSSLRILCEAMSILSAMSKVKVILCSSYKPRAAYLNTSNVMYRMMLVIRFAGIGDLVALWKENQTTVFSILMENKY